MKEVIEMFTKPPSNDFEGWLVLSLVWLCFVLVIGLIVAGLLAAINSWFRPKIEGYGEVVAMEFEPAHYSTYLQYNPATKTSMPIQTWHPNAWKLIIDVDGVEDDFYLSKEKYVKHKIGQKVWITYTTGRLWNSIDIKEAIV